MSLTAQVKNWYIKSLPGQNSKIESLDLKKKWVEKAQNCRFEKEPGSLDKREPLYHLNTTSIGANPMVGLYRYYNSDGLAIWVGINGSTAYSITDAGVKTSIRTSLTDGKRCSFVTYRDNLIVSNGYDDMWTWDGDTTNNVTWELGSCKALLADTGAGLEFSSDYSYRITFDEDVLTNGATSNTVTTAAGISNINLSEIPLGPTGTTDRKIYRTKKDGTSYFLIGYLGDNTTTTFADTITDAAIDANSTALTHGTIGDAYPSVTDDMPKGSYINTHRERFFITRDPSNTNKIYYSNPYLPHYIQQTVNLDYMEISPEDGDEIMGIPIQLGEMICIKKNSIRKIHVTSAISGADPATWYADDPIVWLGCPAPWSITQTPNGVVFLGWDHWYNFDGASAQPLFDEFDTGDILEANYSDVVGYFHKENFYAAYTDKLSASQEHNRLMVYNIKRQTLAYDLWTSTTLTGPNCFGARSGDDEVGDLFFGDSAAGYILKEKDTNSAYRLRTKTDCNAGTTSDTFVGGTENSPLIEIGDSVSADKIPDDICIFWDNDATTPGSGWTEITGDEDMLIKIAANAGTKDTGTSHVHTLTGDAPMWTGSVVNMGDGASNAVMAHTHAVAANADSATPLPRNIKYRLFKKNNTTTEYEFPMGAIIMWDQATPPTGYQLLSSIGYYVMQDTEDLGVGEDATHSHSFSIPTGTAAGSLAQSDSGENGPRYGHTHTITGALSTETLNTWEVAYVAFPFIKRVGESETWDGTSKYAYALFASGTAASQGWAAVDTYNNMFLKMGSSLATGSAANASHTHTAGTFDTSTESAKWGNGGYHAQGYAAPHTHSVILEASSEDLDTPPSVTFRLMKKELGKMKDYNDAIGSTYNYGIWTSPAANIKADSLDKVYWNESIGSDDVEIFTRTGSTQALAEDATAIDTVTNATNTFTETPHGLIAGDRVVIDGTVLPSGLYNTIMYYVLYTDANDFQVSLTSGGSAVTFSSDGTAVTFKKWDGGLTDSNGSAITSDAADWLQYCIVFTASESKVYNPQVYFTNGYVIKYEYHAGVTVAESSVNFEYGIGFRNFDEPSLDKVFKKMITAHEGSAGSYQVYWETENSTGTFTIPLYDYPLYWDSYFPSDCMGKKIDFTIKKNDLNSFRVSELKGIYSPYQVIL